MRSLEVDCTTGKQREVAVSAAEAADMEARSEAARREHEDRRAATETRRQSHRSALHGKRPADLNATERNLLLAAIAERLGLMDSTGVLVIE